MVEESGEEGTVPFPVAVRIGERLAAPRRPVGIGGVVPAVPVSVFVRLLPERSMVIDRRDRQGRRSGQKRGVCHCGRGEQEDQQGETQKTETALQPNTDHRNPLS